MAASSPLQCLSQIQADLPAWLERIDALLQTVNERYAQWSKEAEQGSQQPELKEERNSSIDSLRPQNERVQGSSVAASPEPSSNAEAMASLVPLQSSQTVTTPPPVKVELDPHNRHLFREAREMRKKRKAPSVKDGASGPSRFRLRRSLTVWYDSSVQNDFESLVRMFSGARNTLRKGKAAASFKSHFGHLESRRSSRDRDSVLVPLQPKDETRPGQPVVGYFAGPKATLEVYDSIDRELEGAMTLCEVGAHQFLRDADCFDELDATRLKIEKCRELLGSEIETLREKEGAEGVLDEPATESPIKVDYSAVQRPKRSPSNLDPDAIAIDGFLEADDNSDQESIEIDILQLPGRRHYSSRHLMMSRAETNASRASDYRPHTSGVSPSTRSERPRTDVDLGAGNPIESTSDNGTEAAVDSMLADSGINVASIHYADDKEPELDLKVMRNSVGYRASSMIPDTQTSAPTATILSADHAEHDLVGRLTNVVSDGIPTEPELDLTAMRHSIGRRSRVNGPVAADQVAGFTPVARSTSDSEARRSDGVITSMTDDTTLNGSTASEDESEPDLAVMRASIKPGKASALTQVAFPRADSKQNSETTITKVEASPTSANAPVENIGNHDPDGNEIPMAPELAIDADLGVEVADANNEPEMSAEMANILNSIRQRQRV